MTQKDILESVLHEIKHIKTHMPNGELKQMQLDMNDLKEDISEMKYTLLNPENGVIVNTNKNTEYRVQLQANQKEFDEKMLELENIKRWRDGVNRALWIIFGSLLTIIVRMIMMHSDKI
jgi:predicted SprT family Zn-dependent metalloprotease